MTTEQGNLSDREYITLLEAKVDVLEKTIARLKAVPVEKVRNELTMNNAIYRGASRILKPTQKSKGNIGELADENRL